MRPAGPERRVTRPTDVRLRGFAETYEGNDASDSDNNTQNGKPRAELIYV